MKTRINLTPATADNIRALRMEAREVRDEQLITLCTLALYGDLSAWNKCMDVIDQIRLREAQS